MVFYSGGDSRHVYIKVEKIGKERISETLKGLYNKDIFIPEDLKTGANFCIFCDFETHVLNIFPES